MKARMGFNECTSLVDQSDEDFFDLWTPEFEVLRKLAIVIDQGFRIFLADGFGNALIERWVCALLIVPISWHTSEMKGID